MIGWLKQQYNDLLIKIFPLMPSYIAKECYEEFDEKYKEFRIMTEKKERWIVDDAGTLIDIVTRESFDIVEEIVDTLNYYEETCLKYEKTIGELKDGTYVEPLPITSRK